MKTGKLMERVSLLAPPNHEEALAELELLHFESDLLQAKISEFEDQDQFIEHLQGRLDDAASQIVELRTALRSSTRNADKSADQIGRLQKDNEALQKQLAEAAEQKALFEQRLMKQTEAQQPLNERLNQLEAALAQATRNKLDLRDELARLQARYDAMHDDRENLKLDLLSILRKLGDYPQGFFFRLLPGYRRLLKRYRNRLSDS